MSNDPSSQNLLLFLNAKPKTKASRKRAKSWRRSMTSGPRSRKAWTSGGTARRRMREKGRLKQGGKPVAKANLDAPSMFRLLSAKMMRFSIVILTCSAAISQVQAQAQIGMRARDASPEVVMEMERSVAHQENPSTVRQVDRNTQAIRQDNAAMRVQLATVLTRLADITTEMARVKQDLAQKDMSRVAVLEQRFEAAQTEKREMERQNQKDRDRWMNWFQSLAGGVALSIVLNWFRGRNLKNAVTAVKVQTNGMSKRMETLAAEKGYWHGVATGLISPEQPFETKPGNNSKRFE